MDVLCLDGFMRCDGFMKRMKPPKPPNTAVVSAPEAGRCGVSGEKDDAAREVCH